MAGSNILTSLLVAAGCVFLCSHNVFSVLATGPGVPMARVYYTVWDSNSKDGKVKVHGEIDLSMPVNSSFYEVMLRAAKENMNFRFKSDVSQGEHYITSIGGRSYNKTKGFYWMIYKLLIHPQPSNPPSEKLLTRKGVDRTFVSDGDYYLFWLKEVKWAESNNASS